MVTFFLVFIITKGALTLYEGNTIGIGAVRVGDTGQYLVDVRLSVVCGCPDVRDERTAHARLYVL